ncbi:MAG: PLP-dependent aminotransferase family protein [Sulfuriferula sp.]|nr:PLP-dependent aminotransferase family protein [Sulfuriferula sp.]
MESLYQQLALEMKARIETGVYVAGQRLLGVRSVARMRGVSVATAVAAYQVLTDTGYIEARSRSGFYVLTRHSIQAIEPKAIEKTAPPQLVTGQAMAMALIKAANDPSIVQLGAAVPDSSFLPTHSIGRALVQVIRTQRTQSASYMMPPGAVELRRQIARRMGESGSTVSADDIVITTGCQEALSLALRAVTKPGDVVAVESPAFYGLLHVMESLGLEALEIPAHPRNGIVLDTLAFALERWPVKACVFSPNFSNPLGYCMSDEAKHALIRLLEKHKIPLIEDDVYGDLGFNQRRPSTCKGLAPNADILYCSSFSKTLAPGLRIGWVAAEGARRERIEYLKYVTSIASPTVPQLAVAELLANGRYERYLREVRGKYASAVARMSDVVMQIFPSETRISQPQGGFVLWVELPEGVDSFALARRAIDQGVSVAPGPLFSAAGKFSNFIRLSSARVWDARMESALVTLARLI